MKRFLSAMAVLLFSMVGSADDDCSSVLKIYALDSIREVFLDDWQHENKIGLDKINVEIGKPMAQKRSKFASGVVGAYSVQIKIRSGDNSWDIERLIMIGKNCTRNIRAELDEGIKILEKKKK